MKDQYMSLITDYIDGTLTAEREKEFDQYVEEGHIDMKEVESLMNLNSELSTADQPEPSAHLKQDFYRHLSEEIELHQNTSEGFKWSRLNEFFFQSFRGKLAFAAIVLILGIAGGRIFSSLTYERKMDHLSSQMTDMKEMMMMSMLEKKSVSDRLKGVQMSSEVGRSNEQVTKALFVTLNNDESTNVRIAALNALAVYADDPKIREGLINSISKQRSPLMQLALAELMVELQEEKALKEFEPVLEGDQTPEEVKTTLRESLDKIM